MSLHDSGDFKNSAARLEDSNEFYTNDFRRSIGPEDTTIDNSAAIKTGILAGSVLIQNQKEEKPYRPFPTKHKIVETAPITLADIRDQDQRNLDEVATSAYISPHTQSVSPPPLYS